MQGNGVDDFGRQRGGPLPARGGVGLVQDALGMAGAAEDSFRAFIELRPEGGIRVNDAAMRLSRLVGD